MTKFEAASRMAHSLLRQAQIHSVDLSGLTIKNFNNYLDDAFNDGGETRCEKFADLAGSYSNHFGPIDSDERERATWECIELAIDKIHAIRIGMV